MTTCPKLLPLLINEIEKTSITQREDERGSFIFVLGVSPWTPLDMPGMVFQGIYSKNNHLVEPPHIVGGRGTEGERREGQESEVHKKGIEKSHSFHTQTDRL